MDDVTKRATAILDMRWAAQQAKAAKAQAAMDAAMAAPLPTLTPAQIDRLWAIERANFLGRGWRARTPEEKKERAKLQKLLLIQTRSPIENSGSGPQTTGQTHYTRLSPLGHRYCQENPR